MAEEKVKLSIRSKIWIQDQNGEVVFGLGRLRILDAVSRHGSLHAAAKELKMGYRALWSRITATEKRLGMPLLVKSVGGASGGGSRLTPLAENLVKEFSRILRQTEEDTDALYDKVVAPYLETELPGKEDS